MTSPQIDTAAAEAAGVQLEEEVYEDYFGFDETLTYTFPDGKQNIKFKPMTEGKKSQFQKNTNRDVVVERASGNARMKVDPASERQELLKASVVDWFLVKRNPSTNKFEPVPFTIGTRNSTFELWLEGANPKLVEELERAVRKANPWLLADQTVEEIDKEIESLQEARAEAVKRERANSTFP